jgi:hypothetical protein
MYDRRGGVAAELVNQGHAVGPRRGRGQALVGRGDVAEGVHRQPDEQQERHPEARPA